MGEKKRIVSRLRERTSQKCIYGGAVSRVKPPHKALPHPTPSLPPPKVLLPHHGPAAARKTAMAVEGGGFWRQDGMAGGAWRQAIAGGRWAGMAGGLEEASAAVSLMGGAVPLSNVLTD